MASIQIIILFIFIFCKLNYVITSTDLQNVTDSGIITSANELCTGNECIMKCCPWGTFYNIKNVMKKGRHRRRIICDTYHENKDIFDLDKDSEKAFTSKANLSNFDVKSGIFETNETFKRSTRNFIKDGMFNFHISKDAELLLEIPNAYDRFIHVPNDMFCLDYEIVTEDKHNTSLKLGVWVQYKNVPQESRTMTTLYTAAMLVSCFFLMLVLFVYSVLPSLRNLGGMILMAYVSSLFGAFFLLALMRVTNSTTRSSCISFTLLIYYFFMASFCWMNVMSFDIWWTFRSYAKARAIHRRGEFFKFLMYCAYAFGIPLAMTTALGIVNSIDLSDFPWFVTPKIPNDSCFIKGGEQFLYLYIPMMILILCNWVFYIMTAFNVWRLSRGASVLDSAAAGTTERERFFVYLKLSVIMGLNWLLEAVSYLIPNSKVWYISDLYNILLGVSIFLIFVCKRKILKKLKKRFTEFKASWKPDQEYSAKSTTYTNTGDTSQSQELSQSKGLYFEMHKT